MEQKVFRVRTEQDGAFVLKALYTSDLASLIADKVSILNTYPLNTYPEDKVEAICLEFSEQIFDFCLYLPCLDIDVEHIARIIVENKKLWAFSELLSYLERQHRAYYLE